MPHPQQLVQATGGDVWGNAGAGGSDLTTIAGMVGWWSAVSLFGAYANGAGINSWVDSSPGAIGSNSNMNPSATKPLVYNNRFGHYPGVNYTGTQYQTTNALSATTKPFTLAACIRVANDSAYKTILGCSAAGGIQYRINNTGEPSLVKLGQLGIGGGNNPVPFNKSCVIVATYSNVGAYAHYLNGVANGSGTNDTTFTAANVNIGYNPAGSENFIGDIAMVIRFNSVLSTLDRNKVEAYMYERFDVVH